MFQLDGVDQIPRDSQVILETLTAMAETVREQSHIANTRVRLRFHSTQDTDNSWKSMGSPSPGCETVGCAVYSGFDDRGPWIRIPATALEVNGEALVWVLLFIATELVASILNAAGYCHFDEETSPTKRLVDEIALRYRAAKVARFLIVETLTKVDRGHWLEADIFEDQLHTRALGQAPINLLESLPFTWAWYQPPIVVASNLARFEPLRAHLEMFSPIPDERDRTLDQSLLARISQELENRAK